MIYVYGAVLVSRPCPVEISLTRRSILLSAGAGVHETAQLDTAPDYEFGGQEFKSLRARQQGIDAADVLLIAPNWRFRFPILYRHHVATAISGLCCGRAECTYPYRSVRRIMDALQNLAYILVVLDLARAQFEGRGFRASVTASKTDWLRPRHRTA